MIKANNGGKYEVRSETRFKLWIGYANGRWRMSWQLFQQVEGCTDTVLNETGFTLRR